MTKWKLPRKKKISQEKPKPTFIEQALEEFRELYPVIRIPRANIAGQYSDVESSKEIEQFLSEKLEEAIIMTRREFTLESVQAFKEAWIESGRKAERTRIIEFVEREMEFLYRAGTHSYGSGTTIAGYKIECLEKIRVALKEESI